MYKFSYVVVLLRFSYNCISAWVFVFKTITGAKNRFPCLEDGVENDFMIYIDFYILSYEAENVNLINLDALVDRVNKKNNHSSMKSRNLFTCKSIYFSYLKCIHKIKLQEKDFDSSNCLFLDMVDPISQSFELK